MSKSRRALYTSWQRQRLRSQNSLPVTADLAEVVASLSEAQTSAEEEAQQITKKSGNVPDSRCPQVFGEKPMRRIVFF